VHTFRCGRRKKQELTPTRPHTNACTSRKTCMPVCMCACRECRLLSLRTLWPATDHPMCLEMVVQNMARMRSPCRPSSFETQSDKYAYEYTQSTCPTRTTHLLPRHSALGGWGGERVAVRPPIRGRRTRRRRNRSALSRSQGVTTRVPFVLHAWALCKQLSVLAPDIHDLSTDTEVKRSRMRWRCLRAGRGGSADGPEA